MNGQTTKINPTRLEDNFDAAVGDLLNCPPLSSIATQKREEIAEMIRLVPSLERRKIYVMAARLRAPDEGEA